VSKEKLALFDLDYVPHEMPVLHLRSK